MIAFGSRCDIRLWSRYPLAELVPYTPIEPSICRGVVSGVFQRMPRTLQEQPVLRIHHPRGLRRETEELSVEFVDPVEERGAPDVGVIGQGLFADAGGYEVVLRQRDDRFLVAPQIAPER